MNTKILYKEGKTLVDIQNIQHGKHLMKFSNGKYKFCPNYKKYN